MALVIHRRGCSEQPLRLLLLGGDGRWARPLLRLLDGLGFHAQWLERLQDWADAQLTGQDLVLVGDQSTARWYLENVDDGARRPLVVMTGSLLGLSTAISSEAVAIPYPLTAEALREALGSEAGGG